uniref:Uncharacterized protein n=1 Tax=viral metagenome TaxID=1070528 RepID=A0A6C0IFQ6_9ZZZZ
MAKSRKNRSTKNNTSKFLKTIGKTSKKAVPLIKSGLKTIGVKATPIAKKGAKDLYGALKSGFDLGIKGINSLTKSAKKSRKRRR